MLFDILNSFDFDPLKIRKYLFSQGWYEEDTSKKQMWLFRHRNYPYGQIYVPKDADIPSFKRGVLEIIECLKEVESRSEIEIIDCLLYPDSDIVRYCICSPQSKQGTISLSVVDQLIGSIVQNFKAAICDIITPQLHHPRMKRRETDLFFKNTQFAVPEHGSFVIKVLCPLNGIDSYESYLIQHPIVRQVTTHLLTAARRIVYVIENDKKGELIDQIKTNVQKEKISVDFCLALSQIQIWEDASLELSSCWAATLPQSQDVPNTIKIPKTYFPRIAEIVDAITPLPNEQRQETFIAMVDECRGNVNVDGVREGVVVLRVFTKEGEEIRAFANLSPKQYKIATDIHIKGEQYYVLIQGKLIRKSRSCEIVDITNFQLPFTNEKL
jgi:hypothetical protein